MIDLNKKAKEIFEQNKAVGWWDDMDRCIFQTIQLINTEISEATEGARKDLMDDHLPHRKMEEVELADALIRTLDLGGRCGWVWHKMEGHELESISSTGVFFDVKTNAGKHLCLVALVTQLLPEVFALRYSTDLSSKYNTYSTIVNSIISVSNFMGYDIISAMNEKLEYNKSRLDHKRENRSKDGGKAF